MAANRGNDLMRPLDCCSSGESIWEIMAHVAYCKSQKVNSCHHGTIREACDFVLKFINQNCSNTHLQIILHIIEFLFKNS